MNLFQDYAGRTAPQMVEPSDDLFPELQSIPLAQPSPPKPRIFKYPSQELYNADLENILKAREAGPVSIEYGRNWSLAPVGEEEPITTILKPGTRPEIEISEGRIKPGEVFYQTGIGKLRAGGPTVIKRRLDRYNPSTPPPEAEQSYTLMDAIRGVRGVM